jgi:hypothetical protein
MMKHPLENLPFVLLMSYKMKNTIEGGLSTHG